MLAEGNFVLKLELRLRTLENGRSSSVIRSNRELVWCILSDLAVLCADAALVLLSPSSPGCASWPSKVGVYVGEMWERRRVEVEVRGVRVESRCVCVCDGGAVVLLLLAWVDGERPSSLLPFLNSGNRERVKRRL